MVTKEELLLRIYETTKSPHSFGGIEGLLLSAKKEDPTVTKKDVIHFLEKQECYTLHKNTRKKFLRRKILAPKPGVIASCDLADVTLLSDSNDGYKYILIFIDIFSRFAQARPVKRKDGVTIASALKDILESGFFDKLRRLNSDEGREFYNKNVNRILTEKGIILYSTSSREIKASLAERLIRTIKGKLYRYMSHNNTRRYIDILPTIIDSYNNSAHRSLGNKQTPFQVHLLSDYHDIKRQFNHMFKYPSHHINSVSSDLPLGQLVRIADEKRNHIFRRGYTVQNTIEIFRIKKIDQKHKPTVYYLEDLQEGDIKGIFYRDELVPTKLPEFFHIDIIRSKRVSGKKKYLVRWRGYPDSFNSWIDEDQITSI